MDLRQKRYEMLAQDAAFRPSLPGWNRRQDDLRAILSSGGTNAITSATKDLAAQREGVLAQAET